MEKKVYFYCRGAERAKRWERKKDVNLPLGLPWGTVTNFAKRGMKRRLRYRDGGTVCTQGPGDRQEKG